MKSYKLYLADKHHLAGHVVWVVTLSEIDKATHFLQPVLIIGRNAYLRQARHRDMVYRLDDAVALVFGHEAHYGILHAILPDEVGRKLEHKGVALMEGGVYLNRKVVAIHHRLRNKHQVGHSLPNIRRIARSAILRVSPDFAHLRTQRLSLVSKPFVHFAIDFLQAVNMRIVVNQRRVEFSLRHLILLQHSQEVPCLLKLALSPRMVNFGHCLRQMIVIEYILHIARLDNIRRYRRRTSHQQQQSQCYP